MIWNACEELLAVPIWGPWTYETSTSTQAFGLCSSALTALIASSGFSSKSCANRSTCFCVSQIVMEPVSTSYACAGVDMSKNSVAKQRTDTQKVGAAAGRILIRNHGHRYYGWCYEDGVFRFFEHPVHFVREQAYEGKYVIQTEEPNLSAVEAVRLYKELSEVERAFANLKDVIDLRPIYHRTDDRVQAHIFVAALAFLLHRAIEKKLNPTFSTRGQNWL